MMMLPPWQKAVLLFVVASVVVPNIAVTASRAYPHGCLYRHPSYYTYDERDDISWISMSDDDNDELENGNNDSTHDISSRSSNEYIDFRRLPPKSSPLRRPYHRYRLTRRLGAGKFSDVFEALDVRWKDESENFERRKKERRRRIRGEDLEEDSSSGEGGGVKESGYCTESAAEESDTEADNIGKSKGEEIDQASLVVLKCLKPVSERKIRRELLILTHCESLPNVARVIGIVLPDSMDCDADDSDSDSIEFNDGQQEVLLQQDENVVANPKRRRRHGNNNNARRRVQRESIGSITDAASMEATHEEKKPSTATTSTQTKSNTSNNNNNLNKKSQEQHEQHGSQLPALVLEHAGQKAQWFCHNQQHPPVQKTQPQNVPNSNHLNEYETKYYLCHLIVALDGLHAAGIMHRDVKPRNTLINRFLPDDDRGSIDGASNNRGVPKGDSIDNNPQQTPSLPPTPQPLMLVDLGLADFYLPGKSYNVRVASRHYKSPELLIGYEYYDYAIDMWSVGCMLAGLLFGREPFFRGKDNEDQLGKIVSVLGTRDFLPYCRKCNVRLSSKCRAAVGRYCSKASSSSSSEEASLLDNDMGRRKPWLSFLSPACPIPSPEALDLLDKLLVYDHEQRWTAREALGHSFFDDVRERVLREVQERAVSEGRWRSSLAARWR